jgi:regulator of RNase E activity RraB
VADFINDNRYGDATATSVEDEHRVSVLIEMPITQHVLCSVSGLMACLSEIFDVEYDGWGSALKTGT